MNRPKAVELKRHETKDIGGDGQQCSTPTDCCETIREAAYYKWEVAGCPSGDGVDFWLEAEAELTSGIRPSKPR